MIATQAANMTDKAIKRRGRNQYKRATRQQASEMQYRYAAGESQQNIADALGFDQTYVSRVLSKQIVHLLGSGDALPSLPKRTRQRRPAGRGRRVSKLTEDEVRQIRQLCGTLSQERIAKAFGVSKARINQIAAGRAWRHVT
jgi:predicted XRE-type DNA-binding protein